MPTRTDEWVKGFVLKTQDMGEADVLATWFTQDLGKVRGVVTGGRKLTSRLLAGIRSGAITELRLVSRDGHGLYRLAGAKPLWQAQTNTSDLGGNILLQWFLEVVFRSLPDMQKNEAVFVLAEDFFKQLERMVDESLWPQFLVVVLNNFLTTIGVAIHTPPLEVVPKYFSVSGGGFFETTQYGDRQLVDLGVYTRYLSLQNKSVADVVDSPIEREKDHLLFLWLHQFLEYHIDRRIRSFEFVNGILNHASKNAKANF